MDLLEITLAPNTRAVAGEVPERLKATVCYTVMQTAETAELSGLFALGGRRL